MRTRRIVVTLLLTVVLVLPCIGCELDALMTNPDAAQTFIDQRIDRATDLATNWSAYAVQLVARLDGLFAAVSIPPA